MLFATGVIFDLLSVKLPILSSRDCLGSGYPVLESKTQHDLQYHQSLGPVLEILGTYFCLLVPLPNQVLGRRTTLLLTYGPADQQRTIVNVYLNTYVRYRPFPCSVDTLISLVAISVGHCLGLVTKLPSPHPLDGPRIPYLYVSILSPYLMMNGQDSSKMGPRCYELLLCWWDRARETAQGFKYLVK